MRVLLVSKELAPYAPTGGIGTYTRILGEALAQAGQDVHVLCVHPGLPERAEPLAGFTVHTAPLVQPRGVGRLSGFPAAWGRLTHAWSVWRAFRSLGIAVDVVEAPELYAESLFIGRFARLPLVVRLHSSAAQLFPMIGRQGRDVRITVAIENAAIRRADIVVSTAPNLASSIRDLGLEQGRTRAIIYPVRRRELVPPSTEPALVLFVGRLEYVKNPEVLVSAVAEVRRTVPDVRLRLVGSDTAIPGEGSYRARLEAACRALDVEDVVEFAGELQHERVFDEMGRATVCAFPSRIETFGNVVAEAASIGRPVVVSDIPAFRDFVEDGVSGRVVPVEDPGAWAAALTDALSDRAEANRMALKLRDTIAQRADPSRVAALAMESYEAAIARHRSS
jgi:glycosyltransferase involved in cell wall biosynthesis